MCIVCNAIGYNHSDLNGPGSSLAFNDPLSSWGTSSFNTKNEDSFNSQEQSSSDDLYLYYTLSDVEIAISVDLLLI